MALSVDEQKASYPLPAYAFRVTIDGESVGFAKVSGLQREHDTVIYRHGLSAFEGETLIKFYRDKWFDMTLERGVAPGTAKWLYKWLESSEPRSLIVDLCDADANVVIRWKVAKAVAVKITAPTFDATSNEVVIESLSLKISGVSVEEKD